MTVPAGEEARVAYLLAWARGTETWMLNLMLERTPALSAAFRSTVETVLRERSSPSPTETGRMATLIGAVSKENGRMTKLVGAVAIFLSVLAWGVDAQAQCTTTIYSINGRMSMCTQCCSGTYCSVTCT